MGKNILILCFLMMLSAAWMVFRDSGEELEQLEARITHLEEIQDPEHQSLLLKKELTQREGQRIFIGVLLTFVSTGFVGIGLAIKLLPFLAQKMTNSIYDSDEKVKDDGSRKARALVAKGKWTAAIAAYRAMSQKNPLNRTPHVEIAKILREHFEDSDGALKTLQRALEGEFWSTEDTVFLLFRMIEIYDEDLQERDAAIILLKQIMERFPKSRHSVKARSMLHEWGIIQDNA